MTTAFQSFSRCPLCAGPPRPAPHFERRYDDPAVVEFIRSYYGGKVPEQFLAGVAFVIDYCPACDFYWHRNVLSEENLGRLYGEWIDAETSRLKQARKSPAERLITTLRIARLLRAAGALDDAAPKVLDVGGGWGTELQCAAGLGCEAMLLETSEERREYARARGIRPVSTLQEIAPSTLDLVLMTQSLEHIPRPREIVESLAARLRPGGVIAVEVPRAHPSAPVLAKGPFQPLEHINGFTATALDRLATLAGLRRVRDWTNHVRLSPRGLVGGLRRNLRLITAPAGRGESIALVAARPSR